MAKDDIEIYDFGQHQLWEMDIEEVEGRNLEVKGREGVNAMLAEGWILLHIYTLRYQEDSVWRERPMAILGKPKSLNKHTSNARYH